MYIVLYLYFSTKITKPTSQMLPFFRLILLQSERRRLSTRPGGSGRSPAAYYKIRMTR